MMDTTLNYEDELAAHCLVELSMSRFRRRQIAQNPEGLPNQDELSTSSSSSTVTLLDDVILLDSRKDGRKDGKDLHSTPLARGLSPTSLPHSYFPPSGIGNFDHYSFSKSRKKECKIPPAPLRKIPFPHDRPSSLSIPRQESLSCTSTGSDRQSPLSPDSTVTFAMSSSPSSASTCSMTGLVVARSLEEQPVDLTSTSQEHHHRLMMVKRMEGEAHNFMNVMLTSQQVDEAVSSVNLMTHKLPSSHLHPSPPPDAHPLFSQRQHYNQQDSLTSVLPNRPLQQCYRQDFLSLQGQNNNNEKSIFPSASHSSPSLSSSSEELAESPFMVARILADLRFFQQEPLPLQEGRDLLSQLTPPALQSFPPPSPVTSVKYSTTCVKNKRQGSCSPTLGKMSPKIYTLTSLEEASLPTQFPSNPARQCNRNYQNNRKKSKKRPSALLPQTMDNDGKEDSSTFSASSGYSCARDLSRRVSPNRRPCSREVTSPAGRSKRSAVLSSSSSPLPRSACRNEGSPDDDFPHLTMMMSHAPSASVKTRQGGEGEGRALEGKYEITLSSTPSSSSLTSSSQGRKRKVEKHDEHPPQPANNKRTHASLSKKSKRQGKIQANLSLSPSLASFQEQSDKFGQHDNGEGVEETTQRNDDEQRYGRSNRSNGDGSVSSGIPADCLTKKGGRHACTFPGCDKVYGMWYMA